jgi:oxepin-CoA hydrolase/3-oxo-5,6-dehydrosuberyl-CoA semialdehyde dehydrogenase
MRRERSFAAGLFVDPAPGPMLANYGLDNLRFLKPVVPGNAIRARLTVEQKTPRKPNYGEVRWMSKSPIKPATASPA